MKRIWLLIIYLMLSANIFAEPIVISGGESPVLKNEEELLQHVFGKRLYKQNIVMDFDLLLDGEDSGEVTVMLGSKNKVHARSLKNALSYYLLDEEIRKIDTVTEKNGFVSFDDLKFLEMEPNFDNARMKLELFVPVEKKKTRTLGTRPGGFRKVNVTPATLSGFINARLSHNRYNWQKRGDSSANTVILTPVINFKGLVLEGECSYNKRSNISGKFRRDYTSLVFDYTENNTLFRLGDIFSYASDYHTVPRLWGLGIKKEQPFRGIDSFSKSIQISILRRSTIEIYINNTLVKTKPNIYPGTYTLDDIPYGQGDNEVKIKIIDDTGREQFIDSHSFLDTSFLRKGDLTYNVSVGHPEIGMKGKRYDTHNTVTSAYIKYGVLDTTEITLGTQINKIGSAYSTGVRYKNKYGMLELRGAYSTYKSSGEKENGTALYAAYTSPSIDIGGVSVGANISIERSDTFFHPYLASFDYSNYKFTNVGLLTRQENIKGKNTRTYGRLYINNLMGLNVSLHSSIYKKHQKDTDRSFGIQISKHLSSYSDKVSSTYIHCSYEHVHRKFAKRQRVFSVGCSITLRNNTVIASNYRDDGERAVSNISVSHEPQQGGFGYYLSTDHMKERNRYTAKASYKHARFKANIGHSVSDKSNNHTQFGFETGLFFADGAFSIAREDIYDGGFVIVRPTGALKEGKISFVNHHASSGFLGGAVIRTSRNNLTSSMLDLSEVPATMDVTQDTVVSYGVYKRGARMDIDVEGSKLAKGVLYGQKGETMSLVTGFATHNEDKNAKLIQFFSNHDGKFIIYNLKPGTYNVSLNIEGCEDFTIEVPDTEDEIDLGTVICKGDIYDE